MAKFELGDWVIDTKTHSAVDIIAIIPAGKNSIIDLYVVDPSDGGYYIIDETNLTEYDKYYWDAMEED
jgi:hypothetical protein